MKVIFGIVLLISAIANFASGNIIIGIIALILASSAIVA